jgi:hypothetical protein
MQKNIGRGKKIFWRQMAIKNGQKCGPGKKH